jgi:hypothetical protein
LPKQFGALLRGEALDCADARLQPVPLTIDLFERSAGPQHFARALALSRFGHTLVQIGQELRIAKRQAHIAVQYGKALEVAGLSDPYVKLEGPPKAASRWRLPASLTSE